MPQQLKVSKIEQTVGGYGNPLWIISFEGKKLTASEKIEPQFKIGDALNVQFHKPPAGQEGAWWYEILHDDKTPVSTKPKEKSYTASPEKIESIEYQNSRNIAVQLYCHVTEQGTPFDAAKLLEIYKVCSNLGKNPIVKEAKKMGAVEQ